MFGGKEYLTLNLSMHDEAWSHWAQGRGKQTVHAVISDGIGKIRRSREAREKARHHCASLNEKDLPINSDTSNAMQDIEVQLSASDWGEACQLVGEPGAPVSTGHLLVAIILESESWKQSGNAAAEMHSGWVHNRLVSVSTATNLTHTQTLRLGTDEKIAVWIIAVGTTLSAFCALVGLCQTVS